MWAQKHSIHCWQHMQTIVCYNIYTLKLLWWNPIILGNFVRNCLSNFTQMIFHMQTHEYGPLFHEINKYSVTNCFYLLHKAVRTDCEHLKQWPWTFLSLHDKHQHFLLFSWLSITVWYSYVFCCVLE